MIYQQNKTTIGDILNLYEVWSLLVEDRRNLFTCIINIFPRNLQLTFELLFYELFVKLHRIPLFCVCFIKLMIDNVQSNFCLLYTDTCIRHEVNCNSL